MKQIAPPVRLGRAPVFALVLGLAANLALADAARAQAHALVHLHKNMGFTNAAGFRPGAPVIQGQASAVPANVVFAARGHGPVGLLSHIGPDRAGVWAGIPIKD